MSNLPAAQEAVDPAVQINEATSESSSRSGAPNSIREGSSTNDATADVTDSQSAASSNFEIADSADLEVEEDGSPMMTQAFFKKLCNSDWKSYYHTPELNEKLWLHQKGFKKIRNLGQFENLKCLYFDGNGCTSLLGLEQNTNLKSLFIQDNCIEEIDGLETLAELRQINISDNCVEIIKGLENCKKLDSFHIKANKLGCHELGDVASLRGLLDCPSIESLDISDNSLQDPAIVDEILAKMPNLKVLHAQNNKFCQKVSSYRKTLVWKIKTLTYLDDRPIFPEDRRRAEAFARGGLDQERAEMKIIRKEKDDKHWENHEKMMEFVKDIKIDQAQKKEKKASMKEMMQMAKAKKEAAVDSEQNLPPSLEQVSAEEIGKNKSMKNQNEFINQVVTKADEITTSKQPISKSEENPDKSETALLSNLIKKNKRIQELSRDDDGTSRGAHGNTGFTDYDELD